jgi:hypothetical protein
MKKCSNCNNLKDFSCFYKGKNYKDGYRNQCIPCFKKKKAVYQKENPHVVRKAQKKYWIKNKPTLSKPRKPRTKKTIEEKREYKRNYTKKYNKTRRFVDVEFKLRMGLRNRLNRAIKQKYKKGSAIQDLGCTIKELKIHLESQFQEGMTWDNWSVHGWHIDHIKPLSSFDLTNREEFLQACHYTNLQPLWAKDNLKKHKKEST